MKLAIIKNGVVENIIIGDKTFAPEGIEITRNVNIGDLYNGTSFTKPVYIPTYQTVFSNANEFLTSGLITTDEALRFTTSTDPTMKGLKDLWMLRTMDFNTQSEKFATFVAAAIVAGVFDSVERGEEIKQGYLI